MVRRSMVRSKSSVNIKGDGIVQLIRLSDRMHLLPGPFDHANVRLPSATPEPHASDSSLALKAFGLPRCILHTSSAHAIHGPSPSRQAGSPWITRLAVADPRARGAVPSSKSRLSLVSSESVRPPTVAPYPATGLAPVLKIPPMRSLPFVRWLRSRMILRLFAASLANRFLLTLPPPLAARPAPSWKSIPRFSTVVEAVPSCPPILMERLLASFCVVATVAPFSSAKLAPHFSWTTAARSREHPSTVSSTSSAVPVAATCESSMYSARSAKGHLLWS